nr:hypothetical protein [Streptomyces sp. TRM68416]
MEIDEPDWCTGHTSTRAGYKVDISHNGPEHVIAPDGREVFRASLTQAPFSSIDRTIGLYVESTIEPLTYTPDEVEQLATDLVEAADQLRALGRELARILAGGDA